MIAWYVGIVIGIIVAHLISRYLTAFRFVMALIFTGGAVVSAAGGYMLAWPLLVYLNQINTIWLYVGPAAGIFVWSMMVWRYWREDFSTTAEINKGRLHHL